MGTSKGYISPTRVEWSQAKRAVTQMLRNNDSESIAKAGSKFATAMKSDATSDSIFSTAVSGILGFSKSVSNHGSVYTLNQIQRQDLIGKPPIEILDELIREYTHNGATNEDILAADALSKALINLNINDLEQLSSISQEVLLKELLINFVAVNFDFRFAEKIGKGRTPTEAQRILKDMQDYIRSSLYESLSFGNISNIDFTTLSGCEYVDRALKDAYSVFEDLYMEE